MDILTTLKTEDGVHKLHVVVNQKATSTYCDNYAKVLQETEPMAGFREGKAPLDVIKKKFARKIKEKSADFMVTTYAVKALEDQNLVAGSRPVFPKHIMPSGVKTWIGEFNIDGTFSFDLESAVAPEIDTVKLKDVVLEFDQSRIDAGIDEQINHLRHELVQKTPTNKPATELDQIVLSITTIDPNGNEIPGLKIQSFPFSFDIKSEQFFAKGLAEKLVGVSVGDSLDLEEEGYRFKVDIEQVNSIFLPQITDENLTSWGFESMDHFREQIRNEWVASNAPIIRKEMHSKIRSELALQNEFDLPQEWVDEVAHTLESRLSQMGSALEQYREGLGAYSEMIAKSDFLLELIWEANKDKLALTDQDLLFYAREEVNNHGLTVEDYISQLIGVGQYFSWSIGHRKTKTLDFLTQELKMNKNSSIEFNTKRI